MGPLTLVAGRIVLAAIMLLAWLCLIKRVKLDFSPLSLWHYLVVGVLGHSVPFALISWGEIYIDSSIAAILMGVMPIFTVILAHFFLRDERFKPLTLVGISFGFAGLLTLVGVSALQGKISNTLGEAAAIAGAVSYASVTIFVRRNVTQPTQQIATGAMVVAAAVSTALAFMFESPLAVPWNAQTLLPVAYLGLFPTALASLLYFHLVRRIGATSFSQVNYIIPLIGSLIGVLFMGEAISARIWVALFLILIGIALVRRAQNRA